jgi:translation initiation factor IF-3
VPTDQALKLAQEADLDLVEIAPQGRPPVCKLMDYGKFKYENAQKARETRRNQTNVIIKEMKLRPKIDAHDYETKKGHVVRFLGAGDKVKITIMFRGREQHRPELGFRLLQKLAEDVQELGFVESSPKQDGRNMIMVLGPHKKKADAKIDADAARATKAQARADRQAEEDAEREAAHAAGPVAQKKERRRSENLDRARSDGVATTAEDRSRRSRDDGLNGPQTHEQQKEEKTCRRTRPTRAPASASR